MSAQWNKIGQDLIGTAAGGYAGWSVSLSAEGTRFAVGSFRNSQNGNLAGLVNVHRLGETGGDAVWLPLGQSIPESITGDQAGYRVSMNAAGDRIVIGSPFSDLHSLNSGFATAFYLDSGENWMQLGQRIEGYTPNGRMGIGVAMNATGDVVAITSSIPTGVDIYMLDGGTGGIWVPLAQGVTGELSDATGTSMSFSNTRRIAVGSYSRNSNAGLVRVFEIEGGTSDGFLTQIGQGITGVAGDFAGTSVALNNAGDRLVVGSPYHTSTNGSNSGKVVVYSLGSGSSGMWEQLGQIVLGMTAGVYAGQSVDLNGAGDRLAVRVLGASGLDSVDVYVLEGVPGSEEWVLTGSMTMDSIYLGNEAVFNDSGTRIGVGSHYGASLGFSTGVAAVFEETFVPEPPVSQPVSQNSGYTRIEPVAEPTVPNANAGYAVSLNEAGDRAAVAMPGEGDGVVRVYQRFVSGATVEWQQLGSGITGAPGEEFGKAVSMFRADILTDEYDAVVAIGCPGANVVRVFGYTGDWVQIGSDFGATGAGRSVSISTCTVGTTTRPAVATGAPDVDLAYVFFYSANGEWVRYQVLEDGQPDVHTEAGASLVLLPGVLVFGEPAAYGNGAAYAFWTNPGYTGTDSPAKFGGDNPSQQFSHIFIGTTPGGRFGHSVSAVRDDTGALIAIGDPVAGTVHIHRLVSDAVVTFEAMGEIGVTGEQFGHSVAIADGRVLVGSPGFVVDGETVGAARVFDYFQCHGWKQTAMITGGSGDAVGWSVDVSRDPNTMVLVGAPESSTNAENAGLAQAYEVPVSAPTHNNQLGQNVYGKAPFGLVSLSASGHRMAVGSVDAAGDAGEVRLQEYSPETGCWTQVGETIPGGTGTTFSESSLICINPSGNAIAVGYPSLNVVRVYELEPGGWTVRGVTAPSGSVRFGSELALAEGRLGVCSSTKAHVFDLNTMSELGTGFSFSESGIPSEVLGRFPVVLSYSGHRVAYRYVYTTTLNIKVRVKEYKAGVWEDVGDRPNLYYTPHGIDHFSYGDSISMSYDGNRLAVGSAAEHSETAVVHIHDYPDDSSTTIWSSYAIYSGLNGRSDLRFGRNVALSGSGKTLVVHSATNNATDAGTVRLFEYANEQWVSGGDYFEEGPSDSVGAISINGDGTVFAVGLHESSNPVFGKGVVKAFLSETTTSSWYESNLTGTGYEQGTVSLNGAGDKVSITLANKTVHTGVLRNYKYESGAWVPDGGDTKIENMYWSRPNPVALSADGNARTSYTQSGSKTRGPCIFFVEVRDAVGWNTETTKESEEISSVAIDDSGTRVAVLALSYTFNGFAGELLYYHEGVRMTLSGISNRNIRSLAMSGDGKVVCVAKESDRSTLKIVEQVGAALNVSAEVTLPPAESYEVAISSDGTKVSVVCDTSSGEFLKSYTYGSTLEPRGQEKALTEDVKAFTTSGSGDRAFFAFKERIDVYEYNYSSDAWYLISSNPIPYQYTTSISANHVGDRVAAWIHNGEPGLRVFSEHPLPKSIVPVVEPVFAPEETKFSLEMLGNWVVVGAPGDSNNAGSIKLLHMGSEGFGDAHGFTGEAPGDQFGWSSSLASSGFVVVGAPYANAGTGAAYLLGIDNGALGTAGHMSGETSGDKFGWDVAISKNTLALAIGAPGASGGGRVRVNDSYDIYGETGEEMGYAVDIDETGEFMAVGCPGHGAGQGRVKSYRVGSASASAVIDGRGGTGRFGSQVSVSSGLYAEDETKRTLIVLAYIPRMNEVDAFTYLYTPGEDGVTLTDRAASLGIPTGSKVKLDGGHAHVYRLLSGLEFEVLSYSLTRVNGSLKWHVESSYRGTLPEGTLSALAEPDDTAAALAVQGGNVVLANSGGVAIVDRPIPSPVILTKTWEEAWLLGVTDVAISGDGLRAAVSSESGTAFFESTVDGWVENTGLALDFGGKLSMNGDGTRIAIGGYETRIYSLLETSELLGTIATPGIVGLPAVSMESFGDFVAVSYRTDQPAGPQGSASPAESTASLKTTQVYSEADDWAPIGSGMEAADAISLSEKGGIIAVSNSTLEYFIQISGVFDGLWEPQIIESEAETSGGKISVAMDSGNMAVLGHETPGGIRLKILQRDSSTGSWQIQTDLLVESGTNASVGTNATGDRVHLAFLTEGLAKINTYTRIGDAWFLDGTEALGTPATTHVRSNSAEDVFFVAGNNTLSSYSTTPYIPPINRVWSLIPGGSVNDVEQVRLSGDGKVLAYIYRHNGYKRIRTRYLNTNGEWSGDLIVYGTSLESKIALCHSGTKLLTYTIASETSGTRGVLVNTYKFKNDNWLTSGSFSSTGDCTFYEGDPTEFVQINADGTRAAVMLTDRAAVANGTDAAFGGVIEVFEYSDSAWGRIGQPITTTSSTHVFHAMALDSTGDRLVCYSSNPTERRGLLELYECQEGDWNHVAFMPIHSSQSADLQFLSNGDVIAELRIRSVVSVRRFQFSAGELRLVYPTLRYFNDAKRIKANSDGTRFCCAMDTQTIIYDIVGGKAVENTRFDHTALSVPHAEMSTNGDVVLGNPTGMKFYFEEEIPVFVERNIAETLISPEGDLLGHSVATDYNGDNMILGGPGNSNFGTNSGSARVYRLVGGSWEQTGVFFGEATGDRFGSSVAMDAFGSRVAVGAPEDSARTGYVRVYSRDTLTGEWTPDEFVIDGITADKASGTDLDESFGNAVALNDGGDLLAVGSPHIEDERGIVSLFRRDGNAWRAFGKIASDENNKIGVSVAFGGKRLAVGTLASNVRVFTVNETGVLDEHNVVCNEPVAYEFNAGGWSVAFKRNGDRLVVGYPNESGDTGRVRVFDLVGDEFKQAYEAISGQPGEFGFGRSVSIDFLNMIGVSSSSRTSLHVRRGDRWFLVKDFGEEASGLSTLATIQGNYTTTITDGSGAIIAGSKPPLIKTVKLVPPPPDPPAPAPEPPACYNCNDCMCLADFVLRFVLALILIALAFLITYPRF